MGAPVFECGDATYTKHFARRDSDRQWFYRIRRAGGFWGRWLPCEERPLYAWYNPAVSAVLPEIKNEHVDA